MAICPADLAEKDIGHLAFMECHMGLKQILTLSIAVFLLAAPAEARKDKKDTSGAPAASKTEAADKSQGMAMLSALVDDDATVIRGSGVVSATSDGPNTGRYRVVFNRDVTGCVYVANVGSISSNTVPDTGTAATVALFNNAKGVFVQTRNGTGTAADRAFMLIVFCAR